VTGGETNLETLRRWYDQVHEAYGPSGDLQAATALIPEMFDPQVEFSPWMGRELEHGSYHGHDGLRRYFEELRDLLGPVQYAPEEYQPLSDDLIVVFTRIEGVGQGSDVPVGQDLGLIYEFRNGLIIRLTAFGSHSEALDRAKEMLAAQAR
jgi:ketosteroid isomerase-like protein